MDSFFAQLPQGSADGVDDCDSFRNPYGIPDLVYAQIF
jgi:hypothetical protein